MTLLHREAVESPDCLDQNDHADQADHFDRVAVFCQDQRAASGPAPHHASTSAHIGPLHVWSFGLASATSLAEHYLKCRDRDSGERAGDAAQDAAKAFCRELRGDTSFVLHDPDHGRILAVRDFFGLYPLYYALPEPATSPQRLPTFSFSIRALLEAGCVAPEINEAKVVEYLDWRVRDDPVNTQTFYQHIHRLLPGHCYQIDFGAGARAAGGFTPDLSHQAEIYPYRTLNPAAYQAMTDDEFVRCFRERFLQSAHRNVPAGTQVAVTLSGGLDSSVVCGVAQSLSRAPVHSIYIDPDVQGAREADYAHAVHEKWHTQHHRFAPKADVYATLVQVIQETAEPEKGVLPLTFHLPSVETASQAGCDVLLTGQGGDQIVGFGYEYLDELYEAQDWPALKTALHRYTQCRTEDLWYMFPNWDAKSPETHTRLNATRFFLKRLKRTRNPRTWVTHSVALITHFGLPIRGLFEILGRKLSKRTQAQKHRPVPSALIRADFAAANTHEASQRLDAAALLEGAYSPDQLEHLQTCFSNQVVSIMEEWAQVLSAHSVRAGHPFLDPEVMELTMATPLKLRFAEGLGRGTLRRAMADYLPEKVLHRGSKSEFSFYAHNGLKALLAGFHERTPPTHRIWGVVDRPAFDALVSVVMDDGYTPRGAYAQVWTLLRVVDLAAWFDYVEQLAPTQP